MSVCAYNGLCEVEYTMYLFYHAKKNNGKTKHKQNPSK